MHLDGFNLNLLVAFDILIGAPTLTEAAARLSLSQPALSGALRKLREHYDDPLIIYTSKGPQLTATAQKLAPLVRQILNSSRDTLRLSTAFDPATSTGHFELRAPDWVQMTFLQDVLGTVAIQAPGTSFTVRSSPPGPAADLFRDPVDMVLTSRLFLSPAHSSELLFTDAFACIAWSGNSHIAHGLTAETFVHLDHVAVTESQGAYSPPEIEFRELAVQRRIRIRSSIHAALPHIVVGTELLAVTSRRFAEQMAKSLPITVFDLPVAVPVIEIFAQWQPYRDEDAALCWLRDILRNGALPLG